MITWSAMGRWAPGRAGGTAQTGPDTATGAAGPDDATARGTCRHPQATTSTSSAFVPASTPLPAAPPVVFPTASAPGGTMFRLGPEHRGRSPFRVPPRRPEIVWTYETRGAVTSSPAIAPDGSILVGSHDG